MNSVRKLLAPAADSPPEPVFLPKSAPNWPPPSPVTSTPHHAPRPVSPATRPMSHRKSVPSPASTPRNTRDELLISLMASEAVIDSRDFDILPADQVDELKKEHQVLSSRHEALSKKLALETKIRDAAISLSRVNASHKVVSKQSLEQLEAANARVDSAQTELWKLSDRLNDVHNRLMEHRAAVLSFSVRNIERSVSSEDSGYDSSNRSTLLSPTLTTPASPSAKSPFDGAHFFAGHANTVVPRPKLSAKAAAAEILSLEAKLKEAKEALASAGKKQVEMTRELSMMRLEKQEIETVMEMDLQAARDTIATLEQSKGQERDEQLKALDEQVAALQREKQEWQMDKEEWERERDDLLREKEDAQVDAEELRQKLEETERRKKEAEDGLLQELEDKNREIKDLQEEMDEMRARWEEERRVLEDEKLEDLARLQEEMENARHEAASASTAELADRLREQEQLQQEAAEELEAALAAVRAMIKTHDIALFSRDNSLQGLLNAIGMHVDGVHKRLEAYAKSEAEWELSRNKLEEDLRSGLEKREAMARDLEEARNAARRDTVSPDSKPKLHLRTPSTPYTNLPPAENGEPQDAARIIAILQPLWAVLPSPEARAAKFTSARSFRTGSPTPGTPGGSNNGNSSNSGVVASLSDLDVRSLKTLYDPRNNNPSSPKPSNTTPFTIEAFAQRVQALMADDRALIERLVRFAQAHDLLKKNAERAQKLAQDGTHALETYQKQVRALEERNASLASKQLAMQEELNILHDTIERLTSEKRELEGLAAEQAETCRQLGEANDTLSARTLTLAEEAAQAPEMVRKQLEAQIGELKKALEAAQEEVDAMRSSEQSQRIALLDELNSMQTENGSLRSQLRALKK